ALFLYLAIYAGCQRFFAKRCLVYIYKIFLYSLPVVGITAAFTGAVLALQSYNGFSRFSAEGAIASVVVLSITRELGPVLTGLMIAGRLGASITAEIASMRVSEQLDAMQTLQTNPLAYLVIPRLIATTLCLPLLVIVADIIGVMGGYLIAVKVLNFQGASYLTNTFQYLEQFDVISGLIKAAIFGFIIASISSFQGYYAKGGATGVGKATTSSVVNSSMLILAANYIITQIIIN
ncbi:MAG: ABC transporter permease, partial [Pseudomonadota bacterium]